jgi:hypothetical protein
MALDHYIRRYRGVKGAPSMYSGGHGHDGPLYRYSRFIEDEFGGAPVARDFWAPSNSYYPARTHRALHGGAPYGYRGARSEIEEAINNIRYADNGNATYGGSRIRVLPSMPRFRYLFTCVRCGGHRKSFIRSGGMEVVLCAHCQYLNRVRE